MNRDQAAAKVFPGTLVPLVKVWECVDDVFSARGLSRDVKTIYVSYTNNDHNLVAAVHPDLTTTTIEIALALPDEHQSPLTYDAIHLKWRTLPLAIRLRPDDQVTGEIDALFDIAIKNSPFAIPRPSEDFEKIRRRGRFRT